MLDIVFRCFDNHLTARQVVMISRGTCRPGTSRNGGRSASSRVTKETYLHAPVFTLKEYDLPKDVLATTGGPTGKKQVCTWNGPWVLGLYVQEKSETSLHSGVCCALLAGVSPPHCVRVEWIDMGAPKADETLLVLTRHVSVADAQNHNGPTSRVPTDEEQKVITQLARDAKKSIEELMYVPLPTAQCVTTDHCCAAAAPHPPPPPPHAALNGTVWVTCRRRGPSRSFRTRLLSAKSSKVTSTRRRRQPRRPRENMQDASQNWRGNEMRMLVKSGGHLR